MYFRFRMYFQNLYFFSYLYFLFYFDKFLIRKNHFEISGKVSVNPITVLSPPRFLNVLKNRGAPVRPLLSVPKRPDLFRKSIDFTFFYKITRFWLLLDG